MRDDFPGRLDISAFGKQDNEAEVRDAHDSPRGNGDMIKGKIDTIQPEYLRDKLAAVGRFVTAVTKLSPGAQCIIDLEAFEIREPSDMTLHMPVRRRPKNN